LLKFNIIKFYKIYLSIYWHYLHLQIADWSASC